MSNDQNPHRITVNKAVPVVLDWLKITAVDEILSDDLDMGMAISDVLTRSLQKIDAHLNR